MTLTSKIFTGMIVGFAFGTIISSLELASDNYINTYLIGGILDSGGQIFISLLKLMVVPLVFFSLTSGVSSLDKDMNLGKIAGKTLSLYLFTTAVAISLGLIIAIFLSPGTNLNLEISEKVLIPESPSIKEVFINIFPTNPINAMAEGNMLQIIVFAIFVGVALRSLGNKVLSIKEMIDKITEIILKMVFIIINLAPYGVFCLISVLFAEKGFTVLGDLSYYFFIVLSVLIIHALVTYSSLLILFTKINPITFLKKIRPVILFAFSTSSSNATMPITLKTVTAAKANSFSTPSLRALL